MNLFVAHLSWWPHQDTVGGAVAVLAFALWALDAWLRHRKVGQ